MGGCVHAIRHRIKKEACPCGDTAMPLLSGQV
jgi:hypothetical protein